MILRYKMYLAFSILILASLLFVLIMPNKVVELVVPDNSQEDVIQEKIEYPVDPNFYNEHPKGDQFSVGITGEEMEENTLEENALIWGVNPEEFVNEFNFRFKTNAELGDRLGDVLPNYKSSNRDVKIILEGLG